MTEVEKMSNFSAVAYVPMNVLDNESYVKLKNPTELEFGNTSKPIDRVNDTHSHNVVDHYSRSL